MSLHTYFLQNLGIDLYTSALASATILGFYIMLIDVTKKSVKIKNPIFHRINEFVILIIATLFVVAMGLAVSSIAIDTISFFRNLISSYLS